ncbi:PA2169 family four-helix-bundle protein [Lacibacter sp. H375]|uniref:ferritin-like domain-containing protein n=1 Tax=Lacibacter sp. H375 TaxID=3133424 RepID=UPI0030C1F778
MEHTTTRTEHENMLNDIIQINNDRIAGYEKAAKHLKEANDDLYNIFNAMALQSRQFVNQLRVQLGKQGDQPDDATTVKGKIYRAWMDVKATFSGDDRKAALESCEYGEEAALKAYSSALEDSDLNPEWRAILETQRSFMKESHDKIRNLLNKERQ